MRPLDVGLSSSAPTKQQVVCSGALGLGPKGRAARQAFFPEALGRRTTYTCLQKRQQTPPWPPVSALRAAVTAVESRGREPSPGGKAGSGQGPLPGRWGGGVCPFIPAAGDCCALARVRPSAGLWGPRAPPEWVAARTAWAARRSGPRLALHDLRAAHATLIPQHRSRSFCAHTDFLRPTISSKVYLSLENVLYPFVLSERACRW